MYQEKYIAKNIMVERRKRNLFVIDKSLITVLLIVFFPICNFIGDGVLSYYDEIIGLFGVIVFLISSFTRNTFGKLDKCIFGLLCLITIIGLISNISYHYAANTFAILIDVLFLWKTFGAYFLFKYIASDININSKKILKKLSFLGKMIIIAVVFLSVFGQFLDLGVTGKLSFHFIKQFDFFWHNQIQTGWLIFGCLIMIAFAETKKTFVKYLLFATVPMLLTFSSLVMCWVLFTYFMLLFWKKGKKIHFIYIIIIGGLTVAFSYEDIVSYFINGGVRAQFYTYAIEVLKVTNFMGSGFGTFGSEMAARYYSKVYIMLGLKDSWAFGMNSDAGLLNDNFFASILGQFGIVGFICYITCLFLLLKHFAKKKMMNHLLKITIISTIVTIAVVMIGSASAKSTMGIFTFSILGLCDGLLNSIEKQGNKCVSRTLNTKVETSSYTGVN